MKTRPYMAQCREPKCQRTILMAFTRREHWQPLDWPPALLHGAEGGDVVLVGHKDEARAVVLTPEELADGSRRHRYMPHAATCAARRHAKHAAA